MGYRDVITPENQLDAAEENQDETDEIFNPLWIPMILTKVLDYLPTEDLKTCCLVETYWAEEGRNLLSRRKLITFDSLYSIAVYLTNKKSSNSPLRHTRFYIKNCVFCSETSLNPILEEFFAYVAPKIEYLQMTINCYNWNVIFGYSMPKLSTLSLLSREHDSEHLIENYIRLPQVKTLHADIRYINENAHCPGARYLCRIMEVLPNVTYVRAGDVSNISVISKLFGIGNTGENKLKHLDSVVVIRESYIQRLWDSKVPLETLSLELHENVETESLKSLLDNFIPTLSSLSLYFPKSTNVYDVRIPLFSEQMKHLKYLKLSHYRGSLSMLINFPNLKELELCCMHIVPTIPVVGPYSYRKVQYKNLAMVTLVDCINGNNFLGKMLLFFTNLKALDITEYSNNTLECGIKGYVTLMKLILGNVRIRPEEEQVQLRLRVFKTQRGQPFNCVEEETLKY